MIRTLLCLSLAAAGCRLADATPMRDAAGDVAPTAGTAGSPTAARDSAALASLLAADRAFAAMASEGEALAAYESMLDADVYMLAGPQLAHGRDSVLAAMRRNPRNVGARATWTPIRGGISADGTQGFTYGYMTITPAEGAPLPAKYVAYWRRGADGWRVVAYKRVPRPAGEVSMVERAPSLPETPARRVDVATVVAELKAAEQAFSDLAQTKGLGPAFEANGAPDAANVGGPADAEFRFGPAAIGQAVAAGAPPGLKIRWAADHVVAAPSGDLGVNLGMIVISEGTGPEQRVPFLTVWRRTAAGWRYVAE